MPNPGFGGRQGRGSNLGRAAAPSQLIHVSEENASLNIEQMFEITDQ
jgi:hypothetical protein